MLFENYLASYRGMRLTVLGLCLLALIMLIANVILACALAFKKDAVVLVPPRLTEETRLVADRTNAGYEKAWGKVRRGFAFDECGLRALLCG